MNTMIAATLMEENQNSNSPYERADMRFTPVMIAIKTETHRERRNLRQPGVQDVRAGDRLDRHHDDPEIPVEPAGHETRPRPETGARELGEGAHLRQAPPPSRASMRMTSRISMPVIR